ncbi:MAG: DNA polymerase III subunit beta [Spirochaetaceae bacterium 4572_59]|nr:MAG: DNA polymerase III subunit beta [Spirochaetaceae bacterium 4572_59]
MRFICDKSVIVKEISIAQEIISSRNALSILSNVLLEAENDVLVIKATDLKVGFETRIPAVVEISGSTTVFCDKFLGILRSLPEGEITFEQNENERLSIKPLNKKVVFELNCISSEKFPELQVIEEDNYFEISQDIFNNMISQTIFSISVDEARYFMNGVYMEKNESSLLMVATDGRRLSYIAVEADINMQDFNGIIIPPKILNMIKKLSSGEGNLSLAVTEKTIFVKFDNQKISSTLIEGQFPNFNRVIPESQDFNVVLQKNAISEALKRVSLLAEQKSKRIYLTFSEGNLNLKSEESEIGMADEDIPCNYSGDNIKLAVNYMYIMDPLKVIKEDNLLLQFTESNRAVTMKCEPEGNYFHIIMPMQMD